MFINNGRLATGHWPKPGSHYIFLSQNRTLPLSNPLSSHLKMTPPPARPVSTVFVVGSLNMDFIGTVKAHNARRFHQPFRNDFERPGGHGANQAVAVYRASHCSPESSVDSSDGRLRSMSGSFTPMDILDFDVAVHMVGMVGDDGNRGKVIKQELEKNHVNTEGIGIATGVNTGFAHVHIDGAGIPEVSTSEGANKCLTPDKIKNWSPAPAMVLVQLETPVDTVSKVIKQANAQDIPIIFNPAPYNEKNNIRETKKLFKVDHLIINAITTDQILELPELTEQQFEEYERRSEIQKRYIDACNEFHNLGAACVVITLGSLGAIASYLEPKDTKGLRNQKIWIFGAKQGPNSVCDETGASDAFIGMYAVEILRQLRSTTGSLDIGAAVELGIKAGGLAVAKLGSMDSIPWRDEVYAPSRNFTAVSPFQFDDEA